MTISLLPSEISRLVLNYLEEENLTKSYKIFLEENSYLTECKTYLQSGMLLPKKIHGKTLREYLSFSESKIDDCNLENQKKVTKISTSTQTDTKILKNIEIQTDSKNVIIIKKVKKNFQNENKQISQTFSKEISTLTASCNSSKETEKKSEDNIKHLTKLIESEFLSDDLQFEPKNDSTKKPLNLIQKNDLFVKETTQSDDDVIFIGPSASTKRKPNEAQSENSSFNGKKSRLLIGKDTPKKPELSISTLERQLDSIVKDATKLISQENMNTQIEDIIPFESSDVNTYKSTCVGESQPIIISESFKHLTSLIENSQSLEITSEALQISSSDDQISVLTSVQTKKNTEYQENIDSNKQSDVNSITSETFVKVTENNNVNILLDFLNQTQITTQSSNLNKPHDIAVILNKPEEPEIPKLTTVVSNNVNKNSLVNLKDNSPLNLDILTQLTADDLVSKNKNSFNKQKTFHSKKHLVKRKYNKKKNRIEETNIVKEKKKRVYNRITPTIKAIFEGTKVNIIDDSKNTTTENNKSDEANEFTENENISLNESLSSKNKLTEEEKEEFEFLNLLGVDRSNLISNKNLEPTEIDSGESFDEKGNDELNLDDLINSSSFKKNPINGKSSKAKNAKKKKVKRN